MQSFSEEPYGQIAFVEAGIRKYHRLIGDYSMREFEIVAQAQVKGNYLPPETIMLPKGGSFDCQIVFLKKE